MDAQLGSSQYMGIRYVNTEHRTFLGAFFPADVENVDTPINHKMDFLLRFSYMSAGRDFIPFRTIPYNFRKFLKVTILLIGI